MKIEPNADEAAATTVIEVDRALSNKKPIASSIRCRRSVSDEENIVLSHNQIHSVVEARIQCFVFVRV